MVKLGGNILSIDKRVETIVKAGDDKKAFDIKVLDVKGLSSVADYFIIMSGNSTRQVVGIGEEIEEEMSKLKEEPLSKNGYRSGTWVLLDYEDILVHVFEKNEREFYNLERLWVDSKFVDIDDLLGEE